MLAGPRAQADFFNRIHVDVTIDSNDLTVDVPKCNTQVDLFFGGGGVDTAHYGRRTTTVYVSLDGVGNDGAPGREKDNNSEDVELIVGGSGDDVLTGNARDNFIWGLAGADELTGGHGDDTLFGGAGNDTLDSRDGGSGNDKVHGASGTDTCRSDPGDSQTDCEA